MEQATAAADAQGSTPSGQLGPHRAEIDAAARGTEPDMVVVARPSGPQHPAGVVRLSTKDSQVGHPCPAIASRQKTCAWKVLWRALLQGVIDPVNGEHDDGSVHAVMFTK